MVDLSNPANAIAIGLNLAMDAFLVVLPLSIAFKAYAYKERLLESDRKFLKAFPTLEKEEFLYTSKLTIVVLWVVILALSTMSISYAVTASKLYFVIYKG